MCSLRPRASSIAWTVELLGSCESALAEIHSTGTVAIVFWSTWSARIWKSGTGGSRRNQSFGSSGGSSSANAIGVTVPGSTAV